MIYWESLAYVCCERPITAAPATKLVDKPSPTSRGTIWIARFFLPATWSRVGMGTGSFPDIRSMSGSRTASTQVPVQFVGRKV